jgi:hypothetical protein
MHRKPHPRSIVAVMTMSACGATIHVAKDRPTTVNPPSAELPAKLFADDFRGVCQGATELSGSDDSCPTILSFDNDNQTKVYDTPPSSDDLVAFLKPFVQP